MNDSAAGFGRFHPVVIFCYLTAILVFTMFTTHPVILALSFCGGLLFCASLSKPRAFVRDLGFYLPLFVLIALCNPLFSHNGITPLFFLNGNPVTKEAILYGVDLAVMMLAVLFWCKGFSILMTSDKVLYLFGRILPKASLVLSMALRFLPLFVRKWREMKAAQIVMGYYSEKGVVAKLTGSLRVFSALVGWALENAVDTGASMRARGYGCAGRTQFALFRWTAGDRCLLGAAGVFTAGAIISFACGLWRFSFYPRITPLIQTSWAVGSYVLFGMFVGLPTLMEFAEALRWHYLRSKI